MKRTLSILAVLLAATFANADESAKVVGNSVFSIFTDQGVASVEINGYDNRQIKGHTTFDNGLLSLELADLGWKGFADDGFVDLQCSASECRGIIGSDSTSARVTASDEGEGSYEIEGTMNHVFFRAKISFEKIEIYGDGSLVLKKDKKKEGRWNGTAHLGYGMTYPAELREKGTLRTRGTNGPDLGLFLIYMVSPLIRN